MHMARLASYLNPCRWRARWVLLPSLLVLIAFICLAVVVVYEQRERDEWVRQMIKRDEEQEKILLRDGYVFAEQFLGDMQDGRTDDASSKFSGRMSSDYLRGFAPASEYLAQKPALSQPRIILVTGRTYHFYWGGVSGGSSPMLRYIVRNADGADARISIEIVVGVEDGAPRITECNYWAHPLPRKINPVKSTVH